MAHPHAALEDIEDAGQPAFGAVAWLLAEHEARRQMFEDYENLLDLQADDLERQALALEVCAALRRHTMVEEELLYPLAQQVLQAWRLVDAALVEHAAATALMDEIETMSPAQPLFDAKVTVLGEYVRHHMAEEEEALLPQLAEAGLDLDALGASFAERRHELQPSRPR